MENKPARIKLEELCIVLVNGSSVAEGYGRRMPMVLDTGTATEWFIVLDTGTRGSMAADEGTER